MRNRRSTQSRCGALASLVALSSLLVCPVAFAEGEAAEVDEAREHFRRGIELFHEGNADAAFVELSRAYELSNNYRLLYNLAQVQAERHDYVAAMDLFRQYLERGGDEVEDVRRETVEQEIQLLKQRVSSLELTLSVDGAEVSLDGVPQEVSGRTAKLRVNAGVVRLEVHKKGYERHIDEVSVTGGETRQIVVTLNAERPVQPSPAPVAPTSQPAKAPEVSYDYTPFWIGFASTAALGGATATFGVLTLDAEKALHEEFDRLPGDPDAQSQKRSELKTMATVTDILGAATIVAGGVSLYLLFDPPKEDEPRQGAELTGLVLTPSGVDLRGSF